MPARLFHAPEARTIIEQCTKEHAPFDRVFLVRVHEPDAFRYDIKVCAACSRAALDAQKTADRARRPS
jgi:hypothetical protein